MNEELRGEINIIPQLQGELNIRSELRNGLLTIPLTMDGVGIESIVFNPDSSMTIILTDGSSYTSPVLKGEGIIPGGITGQVLAKASDEDYDTEWIDPKGELDPATKETLGGIIVGQDLLITEDGVLSVDKANAVLEDNTKPITAAAVYTEVGNINALLASI